MEMPSISRGPPPRTTNAVVAPGHGSSHGAGNNGGTLVRETKKSKNKRWGQFFGGLVLEVLVVGYDIYSLRECNWEDNSKYSDGQRGKEVTVRDLKLAVMVISLAEEMLSSLFLSCKYGSPLDMKTMHTLPAAWKTSSTFAYYAEVLPLMIFGVISVLVAVVSLELSQYNGCDGPQDDSLNGFLKFAFAVYVVVGALFGLMFICQNFALCCACIRNCFQDCWDCCCGDGGERRAMGRAVLAAQRGDRIDRSKAVHIRVATMFELSWQFMYLLWAYHAGAIGIEVAVCLSIVTVVGICLVAVGTQAFADESELWIGRMHTAALETGV